MPVVLLTTGGTIATRTGADGVARQANGGSELLAASGAAGISVVDVMSVDSSSMTPARWQQIAAAVTEQVRAGATGVVITHGTDTLEETALWLALTTDVTVPVVLTGAQRSSDHPESDGPGNLRDALTAAAIPDTAQLGVVVCFAGKLFPALGTRKLDLTEPAGFGGRAPIGSVTDGKVIVEGTTPPPYLGAVKGVSLPRVDIVTLYPGGDAVAIDAYVAAGARGVILEAMGAGNVNGAVIEAVSRHSAAGVLFAVTSRVPFGTLTAGYEPGQQLIAAGALVLPHLRSAQARVMSIAVLATGADAAATFRRLA